MVSPSRIIGPSGPAAEVCQVDLTELPEKWKVESLLNILRQGGDLLLEIINSLSNDLLVYVRDSWGKKCKSANVLMWKTGLTPGKIVKFSPEEGPPGGQVVVAEEQGEGTDCK